MKKKELILRVKSKLFQGMQKQNLALNNLQGLISHKNQPTNQPTNIMWP